MFRGLISVLPGAPAWEMATGNDIRLALKEFFWLLLFSVIPFGLITLLDWLGAESSGGLVASIQKYSSAGEIFFYVGAILGGVFILLTEDFRREELEADFWSRRMMSRERTWFLVFLLVASLVSAAVLFWHHLGEGAANKVLITSLSVYVTSLYFWFVKILYDKLGRPSIDKEWEKLPNEIDEALESVE